MLLQVQIGYAEGADDVFTTLMGDAVEPRRDFIRDHALDVQNRCLSVPLCAALLALLLAPSWRSSDARRTLDALLGPQNPLLLLGPLETEQQFFDVQGDRSFVSFAA